LWTIIIWSDVCAPAPEGDAGDQCLKDAISVCPCQAALCTPGAARQVSTETSIFDRCCITSARRLGPCSTTVLSRWATLEVFCLDMSVAHEVGYCGMYDA
jgi:hypothetical protein